MSPLPSLSDVLLRTQTDERLARLVADGDHRAFAMLVQRHRVPLQRLAARVVGLDRSEDVVQQALLRAWVSLAAGTEVRNIQAWLYRILRNAAYTESARGDDTAAPISDQVADRDSGEAVEHRLILRELVQRIGDLPEHQRTALVETELEGRSRLQIASDMGLSEGAVRQLVHRARTALRLAMTAITPYPLLVWVSRLSGTTRLAGLSSIAEDAAGRSAGLAEPAASGAAAGGALAVKGGVALLAAGAIGGLGWQSLTNHANHRRHVTSAPLGAAGHGDAESTAGARPAGPASAGDIGLSSGRRLAIPMAMITRAVDPSAAVGGHVPQARVQGSDSSPSAARSANPGHSAGSGDRSERSGGGTSGSDGGRSGGDGSSSSTSGSGTRGSDGQSVSSPTTLSTASATTSSDGGSRDTSSGGSTTPQTSGGDN